VQESLKLAGVEVSAAALPGGDPGIVVRRGGVGFELTLAEAFDLGCALEGLASRERRGATVAGVTWCTCCGEAPVNVCLGDSACWVCQGRGS
jgi:hypothetical protein